MAETKPLRCGVCSKSSEGTTRGWWKVKVSFDPLARPGSLGAQRFTVTEYLCPEHADEARAEVEKVVEEEKLDG